MEDAIRKSLNRTLLDMYMACPFTNLKDGESFSDELANTYCKECKFEGFCCLPPDEWGKTLRSVMDEIDEQEIEDSNDKHETEVVLDTYCKQCNNEDCFDEDDDENDIRMFQNMSIIVEKGGVVNVNW